MRTDRSTPMTEASNTPWNAPNTRTGTTTATATKARTAHDIAKQSLFLLRLQLRPTPPTSSPDPTRTPTPTPTTSAAACAAAVAAAKTRSSAAAKVPRVSNRIQPLGLSLASLWSAALDLTAMAWFGAGLEQDCALGTQQRAPHSPPGVLMRRSFSHGG